MAESPQFINATSNNAEIYEYIKWLIENAYQILAYLIYRPPVLNLLD